MNEGLVVYERMSTSFSHVPVASGSTERVADDEDETQGETQSVCLSRTKQRGLGCDKSL